MILVIVFCIVPAVHTRVNMSRLRDSAEQTARHLGTSDIRNRERYVSEHLLEEAREMDLPLQREGIRLLEKDRAFAIELSYTVQFHCFCLTYDQEVQELCEGPRVTV